jgi:prophage antirepressor-like protein
MNIWLIYQLLEKNDVSVLENASKHTTSDGSVRYNLIKVQDLGKFFNISNPAEYFRKIARGEREERFIEFIAQPMGRPAMYIAEPIFYEFLMTSDNPICIKLQDWMFGKVINHIVNDGLYTKAMENI